MHKADIALVKKLLKGDEATFEQFYDQYFPKIYRFSRSRIGDEEVIKEVVQQTFISAMKGMKNYRGEASLLTWLCQISRNETSAWFRKHKSASETLVSLDQNPDLRSAIESLGDNLFEIAHDEEVKSLVSVCLDKLPSAYSRSLEMKYVEGYSVKEIATHMGTSETAVQSMLARARNAFKEVFSDLSSELGESYVGIQL